MKRRDFLALVSSAASLAPSAALAQRQTMPVIGFLHTASHDRVRPHIDAFRKSLSDAGHVEGRNLAIEYRWAEGNYDRLKDLTEELVRHKPAVIAATGGTVAAKAAKAIAPSTIPILFIAGFDPVQEGLVASIPRPGGNATGVAVYTAELGTKRLAMLQHLVPGRPISMLVNPQASSTKIEVKDATSASHALKVELIVLEARDEHQIESAFSEAVTRGAGGILVSADSFFTSRHRYIAALAAQHRLPACYPWPDYVRAGGLISYGPSLKWAYEQIGAYASRILKGDKPHNLPVQLPTTFGTLINLSTAKALSLTIPPLVLIGAETIE